MASLRQTSGGTYFIAFRFDGQRFERSLGTVDPEEAQQKRGVVERTIGLLKDGVLSLPNHCAPDGLWQFVRSGGRVSELPSVRSTRTVDVACREYIESFPDGTKEHSTLSTEKIHLKHLKRLVGRTTPVDTLTSGDIQDYVRRRQTEPGTRGRKIRPVTIGKELQTIRQLWDYAESNGYVAGDNPVGQVRKPRASQKEPFRAWDEIESILERGGLNEHQVAELWGGLFLREKEIGEFLRDVKKRADAQPQLRFLYPALALCAYTGARRSEMFRCLVGDVNGRILLREKKRSQELEITFREVPLHPELEAVLADWIDQHPGGQHLFCKADGKPLEDKPMCDAFKSVTRKSKWSVLRGFHVLRHSFVSNLARHNVAQYKIDSFVGHQTEEQKMRYRHLFPEDRHEAINVLSFGQGCAT